MKTIAAALLVIVVLSGTAWAETPASQSATTRPATGPSAIPFDTYDGYFVSNKFEPNEPASHIVIEDQKTFDRVFGVGMVMGDKSHRLPANAFESKMVLAVVHRGKAVWTYSLQDVGVEKTVLTDGSLVLTIRVLTIRYTATSKPSDSAEFACPLIISVPRGDYTEVQFIENGKLVNKKIALPAAAKPTTVEH